MFVYSIKSKSWKSQTEIYRFAKNVSFDYLPSFDYLINIAKFYSVS